jgi:hypothetical protein
MARFSETVEIKRPPEEVWRLLGQPERWFEGYLETRSRSPGYPAPDTRNHHLYRTRMKEEVEVRVTRSEALTLLEETQQPGERHTAAAGAVARRAGRARRGSGELGNPPAPRRDGALRGPARVAPGVRIGRDQPVRLATWPMRERPAYGTLAA